MDRLRAAEVFVSVVEEGSIQAAARACELSPTMVAKHIRALEDRLGVRLFTRTTRQQSLTEPGRAYYERARELLESWSEAEASVSSLRSEPRGTLRLASPVTFGAHALPALLADFREIFPEVKIDLVLSDRQPSLVEGGFDAAFVLDGGEELDYVARPLPAYRMALGASPGYLARRGTPVHPLDLTGHDCLTFAYFDHPDAWRLIGPDGEFRVPVQGPFRANNGQALLQAALAGIGIVHQPEILLAASFASGGLIRLLPDYAPPARPMSLLYLPDRRMTLKLRRFVDFVTEFYEEARKSTDDQMFAS